MKKLLFSTLLLLGLLVLPSQSKQLIGYYQSWSDQSTTADEMGLSNLPAYITTVILSFMSPDNTYTSGSMDLSTTGLQFYVDGDNLLQAIQTAQTNGASVLVAVGGASATNWAGINVDGISAFVTDFGLDGVDIDYEPSEPGCTASDGTVTCSTDDELSSVVSSLREAISGTIALTVYSTAAYGQGDYIDDGGESETKGIAVNLLLSETGQSVDLVNIMAYDAGTDFDPTRAFSAFKSLFSGAVALGVEVPPEAWPETDPHVLTNTEIDSLVDYVNTNGGDNDGIMVWSLNKAVDGEVSEDNPDANWICQEVCIKFEWDGCDATLDVPTTSAKAPIATLAPPRTSKPKRKCWRR